MLPEKPWSRVHVDHAINFLGSNWLVLIDAYSKNPCIHPTTSTSTKFTTELLEQDFAQFGYPHTIVSDNATSFSSEEFQSWCRERGITHLTGAPYHPTTNGAAERLVQTFKQALPPRAALQEFLIQHRRTPRSEGYSPSELLNGRQIRTKIDVLLPSPAHAAQGKQAKEATRSQAQEAPNRVAPIYSVGTPCYALYCGPRREKDPRWVPAVVTKVYGSHSVKDADPGEVQVSSMEPVLVPPLAEVVAHTADSSELCVPTAEPTRIPAKPMRVYRNPRLPTGSDYSRDNPR
eukprot:Em0055g26a